MNNNREWIVQYHGNIQEILRGTNIKVDISNEKYAIIKAHSRKISKLKYRRGIEVIQKSQPIPIVTPQTQINQFISQEKGIRGISGKGVIVGWVGCRMNINYQNYKKDNGTTRILSIYDGMKQYNKNQIISITNRFRYEDIDNDCFIDQCIGNTGIAPDSEIIFVNFQKDIFYTADIIRGLRFIIETVPDPQVPLVIYLPVDISKESGLIQKIISKISLYGKMMIVSCTEIENKDLELSLGIDNKPLFSANPVLTVGLLALVMEWGIVRRNQPHLHGQKLRTYYIKKVLPALRKDSFYTRSPNLNGLDDLLKLLIPISMIEEYRTLDIAYEFAPKDEIIDAFIKYNSFDVTATIKTPQDTSLYPLVFPYLGVRGTVGEIQELVEEFLGKLAKGSLAYILGSEPFKVTPVGFKALSILKKPLPFKGTDTLIGIIDTGIDYTHPVFIDSKGQTRIISIWDQTIGTSSPYGYGTIYDQEEINQALKGPDPFKIVPHQDEWGSGTGLAGIAAGYSSDKQGVYEGIAPGAEIAIVKLAPATPGMQNIYHSQYNPLAFSALDIARAVQYLASLANQHQKPISICLPLGTNTGPHDGTGVLDNIIMTYAENPGVCVVLSAGEEANKGHHGSGNLEKEGEKNFILTIPKGQWGFMVEIWASFGDRLEVTLTTPQKEGESVSTILLNRAQTYKLSGNAFVLSQGSKIDTNTGCEVIHFRLGNPMAGEWVITVRGIVVVKGPYHIWIPKTGMILPETVLSPASPFTTVYNTSAAMGLITVACYDKKSQSPTPSSGRGFTRDNEVKPDFMVPGVDVPGPLPGNKWGLITGTSPASAITVGIASLVYEDQVIGEIEPANTIGMKAILVEHVKREATLEYPSPSRGYGLLGSSTISY